MRVFLGCMHAVCCVPGSAAVLNSFVIVTKTTTLEFICPNEVVYWEWIRGFRLLFENSDPDVKQFRLVAKLRKKRSKGVIRTGGFEYSDRFCELDGLRMRFRYGNMCSISLCLSLSLSVCIVSSALTDVSTTRSQLW